GRGFLVKAEGLVQGAYGQFHILVVDDDRGLDFAGADHLDVDALFAEGTEHQAGNAHVAAHADADDGHFAYLVVGHDFLGANRGSDLVLQQVKGTLIVVAIDGEGEVGGTAHRLVLHDHVDIDVGCGNRAQDGVSHAR